MEPAVYFIHRDRREDSGPGGGLVASIVLHAIVIAFLILRQTTPEAAEDTPFRYVDLVEPPAQQAQAVPVPLPTPGQQAAQPIAREFLEAPGPEVGSAPENAPLSNANRRATIPNPTGPDRTDRPGVGGAFVPEAPGPPSQPGEDAQARGEDGQPRSENAGTNGDLSGSEDPAQGFRFEERVPGSSGDSASIDWNSAIAEAGRTPTDGAWGSIGGEKGFAESGPISFETQWYPWGDYADLMVRKIRYHWYNNMPSLIRLGVKGVVVIRFTIQRNGQITEVTLLRSSGSPPYDFAARKAIELASPLAPLPKDFPNSTERVTAAFYYNQSPPR